jgi:hypothetical protein
MNTFYLKYQKYKSKYVNLKYKYLQQDLQQDLYGGAEKNLVFNSVTGLIGYDDLAIGKPKNIGNKENILSLVDKSIALKFSYNTLTKNFEVETPDEYKGRVLTMDDYGSDVRFCQIWKKIPGLNRQQFEFDENMIYAIDANIFILKAFGDDLSQTGNLLFKKIDTKVSNTKILLNLASLQGNYLVVKKLIESDTDTDTDTDTYTDINLTQLLHNAIMSKNSDIVSLLLAKATDVNATIDLKDLYFFTERFLYELPYSISNLEKTKKILAIIEYYRNNEEKKFSDDANILKSLINDDRYDIDTCLQMINKYLNRNDLKDYFQELLSFAIPSDTGILKIKNFANNGQILEVGAGNGLWAGLLKKIKCNIIATDNFSTHYTGSIEYITIDKLSHIEAIKKYNHANVLFLCWPPDTLMSDESINLFRGDKLVYIGEDKYGCTGSKKFHHILAKEWKLIETIDIPRWKGIYDQIHLYKRR